MRIANLDNRLALASDSDGYLDVATLSGGQFGPDVQGVYETWPDFLEWSKTIDWREADLPKVRASEATMGPPVPNPRQIFAVGLNYDTHAVETELQQPTHPMIFTKFQSCITGPYGEIELVNETVDWEIELVVVVGRRGRHVPKEHAWSHIAGLTIGQDLSDRALQMSGSSPQFSLAKSYHGFGPIGPYVGTLDELDKDNLELTCRVNGEIVQHAFTNDMLHSVPTLIAYLSTICDLYPGDLIFTGTPPGVGMGQNPPRYLAPGDVVKSAISNLGEMRHHFRGIDVDSRESLGNER